jgi:outer membrane protein
MNKNRLLLALSLLAVPSAWGADSRIISFDEAMRIALEQNITLRQAENSAATAEVAVSEARMQFVPDARFNTSGSNNFGRFFDESEGRIVNQSSRSVNLGVSSGVTLFNGFANTATLRQAKLESRASGLDFERARETVVFTVASNFLSLIQQQEQLRVRRESLAAESALAQQIQTYVNAGSRTVADLYQQQANVASAQFTLVETERAAELARVELMDTLHLDPRGIYEFERPSDAQLAPSGELPTLDDMVARSLEQRTDISAEEARLAASEQSIRVARSGYWPDVSLSAGYNSGYTSISQFDFGEQLDQRRGGSVGLSFSLSLFDRRATANATRRAELRTLNERLTLENLRQDIALQVRRVQLDYKSANEQLSAAQAQERAANLALETMQQRYRAGAATLVEVSQARASQVQAASALVSARYNLLFQRTLADYYLGEIDPARYSAGP